MELEPVTFLRAGFLKVSIRIKIGVQRILPCAVFGDVISI